MLSYCTNIPVHKIDIVNTELAQREPEEASTHISAKTHAGTVFVTHDLDLDLLTPK